MTHYNLVHKFSPMPQTLKKHLDAKTTVDKEWKKLETIPSSIWTKLRSKKELIMEAPRDKKKKVHLMDICHLKKMRSYNQSYRSMKVESCSEVTL